MEEAVESALDPLCLHLQNISIVFRRSDVFVPFLILPSGSKTTEDCCKFLKAVSTFCLLMGRYLGNLM